MQKAHDASKNDYWRNKPDISTPILAEQLNRMETSMDVMDDRIVLFDTTKANQTDMLTCVASITLNTTTGILTVTLKNGTSSTIDTGLSKLAINFDYDDDPTSPHYQQIIMEMKDGTYKYIDLSALITQYEFTNTSTIAWTIGGDGKISAQVINGSITADKLEPNYLANVTAQAQAAAASASDAEDSAEDSEAWAVGTRNGQPVPSTDPTFNNSAKHWAEEAAAAVASSDGHQILDPSGTAMTQRKKLQFAGDFSVTDDATNGRTVVTAAGMVILSYGHSTWSDFLTAYQNNKIVYCRASSSSNPGSGSQTRLAFMAYVSNPTSPTQVEFQYYRTVSNHTGSTGDQIFVYTLTSSGAWSVTVRNVYTVANEVYYDANNTVKAVLDSNIGLATFEVPVSSWVTNSGSDATDFPYIAELTTSDYSANFVPSEVFLVGAVSTDYPTSAERDEISKVDMFVKFTGTTIRLRAIDAPITVLNLLIKR